MPKSPLRLSLNQTQKKHLNSVRWLLKDDQTLKSDGNRKSGRSTLMAYVYIERAYERPGSTMHFCDHLGSVLAADFMADKIKDLIATHGLPDLKVSKRFHTLTCMKKSK